MLSADCEPLVKKSEGFIDSYQKALCYDVHVIAKGFFFGCVYHPIGACVEGFGMLYWSCKAEVSQKTGRAT